MTRLFVCLFLCGGGGGDGDDDDDAFALLNIRYARFACRAGQARLT